MADKKPSSRGSRATPSAANRTQQTRPGDATGMESARLARENAAAQTEAAQRMSLVTSPPVVERPDEVVDYTAGGTPNPGMAAPVVSMDEATADGETQVGIYDIPEGQLDLDALPDGTVDVLPEMVAHTEEPQPLAGARRDSQQEQGRSAPRPEARETPVVEKPHRVMRVNTDLEDITIGKDNHFTFRMGQPYKVTSAVFDHLYEKGYVLA